MFPTPIRLTKPATQVTYRIALVIAVVIWLLPLVAILLTSVRSRGDINSGNYWGWPTEFDIIQNYTEVFIRSPMLRYFLNSLIVTLPVVFFSILISSMAAFTIALHRFKARMLLFAMFIAGNFIPFQILMIPVRTLTINLGFYDTWYALIFFHIAFQAGFCTFFLRNFIVTIPYSLIENARLEGAGEWKIYFKIILPLIKPSLAALGVLIFTFVWNDFFWALTLVQSDKARTITVGLQALRGQWTASWNLIAAGSVVAALPPVIMFFILQKQFIQGLTLGAVKGE